MYLSQVSSSRKTRRQPAAVGIYLCMSTLTETCLSVPGCTEVIWRGGGDTLRDRCDALECDNEFLRLFGTDDAGDDRGAERIDVAAAAIFPALPPLLSPIASHVTFCGGR